MQSTKHFLEYLASFIFKIFPQEKELEITILERFLSFLTHQFVTTQLKSFTHNRDLYEHWSDMQSHESSRLLYFFFELINEVSFSKKIKVEKRWQPGIGMIVLTALIKVLQGIFFAVTFHVTFNPRFAVAAGCLLWLDWEDNVIVGCKV